MDRKLKGRRINGKHGPQMVTLVNQVSIAQPSERKGKAPLVVLNTFPAIDIGQFIQYAVSWYVVETLHSPRSIIITFDQHIDQMLSIQ